MADPITHIEQVIAGQVDPITHLEQVIAEYGGGGGGGTSDYTQLSNKPQINSTELSGNKSSHDLGLQSETLGSWSAGTATTHSTPAANDTVLQALQKIDNNQRNDETNISSVTDHIKFSANSKTYYMQPEQPSSPAEGDIWIG